MAIALIDVLNSREDAILIWAVLIVAHAVWKSDSGLGTSFMAVVGAFFQLAARPTCFSAPPERSARTA